MPHSALEALARRWVPGEGPIEIEAIGVGLVNESYRVTRAGRVYSLRVSGKVMGLGVDREWECRVLAACGGADLAPAVICCNPAQGILIADWIPGRVWTAAEARQPARIAALAALLRRVHSLPIPQPARRSSPAEWVTLYAQALAAREAALVPLAVPPASVRLQDAAMAAVVALAAMEPAPRVLCHSDLHRQNLKDDGRLVLLDWEYAHVSQPFWDLAGWIANNDFLVPESTLLLESYLERPAVVVEWARLALLTWLFDYVCLLWCELHLNLRPQVPEQGIAERAAQLAQRLARVPGSQFMSGGRAGEVPAH